MRGGPRSREGRKSHFRAPLHLRAIRPPWASQLLRSPQAPHHPRPGPAPPRSLRSPPGPSTPLRPSQPPSGPHAGAAPLRVVLVEVGEEQMAAAGVTALPGQVHGGTALSHPRPAGGRLQQAEQLKPGGPGPLRTPAASSSPPAPCLRCGRRRGPAQAPSRPRPMVAHALLGAARPRGHRPTTARAPAARRGRSRAGALVVAPNSVGRRGGGGVVKLSGEREGGRRGGGRAPVEAAVLPRSRGCHRAAGCGRRCPSPAVLLRAAGGPQGSAVGRRRGRALRGGGAAGGRTGLHADSPAPCPSVLLPPHSGCPYGRRAAEPPGNCCSAAIVRLGVRLLPSHMGYCLHMWVIATSRAAIHTRPGGVPTCGTLPVWGLTCLWGGFVAKNPCVWDTPASQKPSS